MDYIMDWSNWDRYDLVYYAREIVQDIILNKEKTESWFVEVDGDLKLYAYNELLGVETEHVFIADLFRLTDEVYRQMCDLDELLEY